MNKISTQRCRACLKSSTKTFPLNKPVTGCTAYVTYAQLLNQYAQIEYNTNYEHQLPKYLCFLCCNQLKSTYVFIQQAQSSNAKLINNLTKQLCLREQVIDLPQLHDEDFITIKNEACADIANLNDDTDVTNSIAHEDNSNHENNLVTNELLTSQPILTTDHIIEHDVEDNGNSNNSFIEEPALLTTDQIIEYDSEDGIEVDNDNFNTEMKSSDTFLPNEIEALESEEEEEDSFEAAFSKYSSLGASTFTCEKYPLKEKDSGGLAANNNNKEYKCQFCDYTAKEKSGLNYHLRSKHGSEDDRFKCKFCSYTSLNKLYLLNHVKRAHIELIKRLKANNVNKTDKSQLNNDCSTNLTTTSANEKNSSDNDSGDSDEEIIRNIINMRKYSHTKVSTKSLPARCEQCGKILKNYKSLRNHQRHVHKSEDMFSTCPHCDKKCKRESDLKIHIRQMHGPPEDRQIPKPRSKEKRFMCAECSYTCTTSTLLRIHIHRHHTNERPYKCDICSKGFLTAENLKYHHYMHTGEKPYQCPVCLKKFRDPSHCRKHRRLHTNEKQYTCDICGKACTESYNLLVHKRSAHPNNSNTLSCTVCGKFFQNKAILNIHQINENHYGEVDESEKSLSKLRFI